MNEDKRKFDALPLLDQLQGLSLLQQELLRMALYIASQGPIEYEGETAACILNDEQRRTSTVLAMAAGQSFNTILDFTKLKGIQVRDCYPIARSAVESFINAAYLLSESDEVAERAEKYVQYAHWKHHNRRIGSGEFTIDIYSDPSAEETLAKKFPEFVGKGKGSWTKLDVPSRIRRVGELSSRKAGARLLAAYGLIYSLSSEIIHGSPFGANYFYFSHIRGELTTEAFVTSTVRQLEEILIAVLHAGCGYLAAFFEVQNMNTLKLAEQKLFDKVLQISTENDEKSA
jgi:hypothetical protein